MQKAVDECFLEDSPVLVVDTQTVGDILVEVVDVEDIEVEVLDIHELAVVDKHQLEPVEGIPEHHLVDILLQDHQLEGNLLQDQPADSPVHLLVLDTQVQVLLVLDIVHFVDIVRLVDNR